jgi:hypothetical protein
VTEQGSLFSGNELRQFRRAGVRERQSHYSVAPPMSLTALTDWKQRVFEYQQQVRHTLTPQQQGLFTLYPEPLDPDQIDPYQLRQQNTEFWQWQQSDAGTAAFYFVIDYELPILLYIGETAQSNQRWKGKHDCKDYLLSYRQIHHQYQATTTLGTAFSTHAPTQTKRRRNLELALIYKWRSPFNKENCSYWNTPFVDN